MKKIICWAALVLALCLPVCAFAATEPNAKTIEDTTTYEGDTIKITIDQWCYAFNRTNLRFFVANVYVSDPAQMQTLLQNAMLVAGLSGYLAIRLVRLVAKKDRFGAFAYYCAAAGVFAIVYSIIR